MSDYILTKTYRWMTLTEDGLLKQPKDKWGNVIFRFSYPTREDAVADYQRHIDSDLSCPYTMILIEDYSKDYVTP